MMWPGAILVVLLTLGASTASAAPPTRVSCDSIVWPVGDVVWKPRRVVLGVVAVPRAYIPQTVETGDRRWPWWSKSGLVVRASSPPVLLTVPVGWRTRVAIGWGQAQPTSRLRIEPCPPLSRPEGWNPYPGGFHLGAKAGCIPLRFTVAGRSATVRLGIGKRCA